ncbi:heme biosynthesis HemY N-terminal domain-containing protein [Candidatus Albibeggiatoa sp. nov. BB20]|uniref:heme biosynthesis HemY N-terminal domain-containing protein n=1 Tax=Candidatus Albibeggiatoa sp. nov. BB20 TaxID=3162723 RepID=UPI0033654CD5
MKVVIFLLLVIAAGIGFPLLFEQDAGFVILSWQTWTAKMSLATFVLFSVISFAAFFVLLKLLAWIWDFPHRLKVKSALHKQNKAHQGLGLGCLNLLQQQWDHAEKTLLKSPQFSVLPALHFVGASFSAYQQGNMVQAADYIDNAKEFLDGHDAEMAFFQAKMLQQQGQLVLAVEQAQHSLQQAPHNKACLLLLSALYLQLADWTALSNLLPTLDKQKVLEFKDLEKLAIRVKLKVAQ